MKRSNKNLFLILIATLALHAGGVCADGSDPQPYSIFETSALAKPSYYGAPILKFLHPWPPATSQLQDKRPSFIRAIKTPGHADIIGMVKHYTIQAPLEKVVETTENFADYPKIWDDVINVKVLTRDKNRTVTEWLRKAPTFFLPKTHYTMLYTSDKSVPGRVVYREQLIDGNAPKTSDGMVVLEKVGDNSTRVSIVSFYEADFGPFRGVIEGKIWHASMEGSYKDDLAFRDRVEHPDWSGDQIKDAVDHTYDQYPIEDVEYTDLLKFN